MSDTPRPKLGLQRPAAPSGDGPKRGPLRSTGFKRHTGQGPSQGRGGASATRASASGPRRDGQGDGSERRDGGRPPRDGNQARAFDPNRPRGPRPERDERAPRFARDDDRAPRFERSERGPQRDDDRRDDRRDHRPDQRPEWRERRDGEGRGGDRRDGGRAPRDADRARSFDPNRPRGPRPERDERAPRFSRDDRAPRFERSEFGPRRNDDRRDHRDRRPDQRPEWRERRDGEGRWGDRRDGGRPPRDGDRARSFDPNRPRGPRPERDERAPRFSRDDRGPRVARDDRAPRFERGERGPRRDDDRRDDRRDHRPDQRPEWRERRDGEGRWGDRRDGGRPPRDGDRARSFDPNRPRGPRPEGDDRGPRVARDDRAPRFERSERGNRRDDGQRDNIPAWRQRSLSTPEPRRDDAQADAGNPSPDTPTTDPTTAPPQPRWPDAERLNKRLAAMGYCSRREADEWIAKGWVRVNDVVVETGVIVGPNDRIAIDPRAVDSQARRATFVIHKPVGFVSSQAEDGHANAASLLSARSQWDQDSSGLHFSSGMLRGLAPAGRLDIDSTGLLVLTQDGRVARHIIGEDSEVEKEYLVRVHWVEAGTPVTENVEAVFPAERLAQLRFGLALDGQALLPAEVEWLNPEQLRFVLREGKKRQIRRMCEAVGLKVVGLKRVRIGRLRLGHLPVGQWRFLREDEHI